MGQLNCSYNNIRELRGGSNSLSSLYCSHNQITDIDIGNLFEDLMGDLYCDHNNISSLDLTGILGMEKVVCDKKVKMVGVASGTKVVRK